MAGQQDITVETTPGPASSAHNDIHSFESLQFPADVFGEQQNHFIKFNIINVNGSEFNKNRQKSSEVADRPGSDGTQGGGNVVGDFLSQSPANPFRQGGPLRPETPQEAPPPPEDTLKTAKDVRTVRGRIDTIGDVVLYLPHSITETVTADWEGGGIGEIANVISGKGSIGGLMQQSGALATEVFSKIGGGILRSDAIPKMALRGINRAVDPHFETFFNSVGVRQFQYDFKLSPKNEQEAVTISNIIRTFKIHASPRLAERGQAQRYWEYPKAWQIEYWNADQTHRIDHCALMSINVNYSGSGDNHTFPSHHPIQTDLSLVFKELYLQTADAYEQGGM